MDYKISKKAAAELKELLVIKDTANILYQWYLDQEKETDLCDPSLIVKRIASKIQVIEIEIRLLEDFGIAMFEQDQLTVSLADYRKMLESVERNIARDEAA